MARHKKRLKRKHSCGKKEKLTEAQAYGKRDRLERTTGARMKAYRCKFKCYLDSGARAWHVGHKT